MSWAIKGNGWDVEKTDTWTVEKRSEAPPQHCFCQAATRMGKSKYLQRRAMWKAKRGDFVLYQCPHFAGGYEFLGQCLAEGFEDRIIFDDLSYNEKVPGYDFFPRSKHPNLIDRISENRVHASHFIDVLCREQAIDMMGPLKGQYARNACNLWANQQEPLPLSWLPFGLQPMTPEFMQMVANCTDERTVRELLELKQFKSPQYLDEKLSPARRFFDPVFESVAFLGRGMVAAMNTRQAMNDGMIWIQVANGKVAKPAVRQTMVCTALSVVHAAEEHFAETGEPLPAEISQDECNAFNLIAGLEVELNAQCLKWGVERSMCFQHLNMEESVINGLLQNCELQVFFRQGSKIAARLAAEQLATRLLDSNKILDIEERDRTINDGFEEYDTTTTNETKDEEGNTRTGITKGKGWRPINKRITDQIIRRQGFFEQVMDFERTLMTLPVGWRLWTNGTYTTPEPEYLYMLEESWFTKEEMDEAIARIRSKPPFQKPTFGSSRPTGRGGASQKRKNANNE